VAFDKYTLSQNIRNVFIIQFKKKDTIFADRGVSVPACIKRVLPDSRAKQPQQQIRSSDGEMKDVHHATDAMRKDGSILCSSSSSSRISSGILSPGFERAKEGSSSSGIQGCTIQVARQGSSIAEWPPPASSVPGKGCTGLLSAIAQGLARDNSVLHRC